MIHMGKIITIGREFGSGGREVGKRLSDELGLASQIKSKYDIRHSAL